jgi:tRNA(adenine34) deaminase
MGEFKTGNLEPATWNKRVPDGFYLYFYINFKVMVRSQKEQFMKAALAEAEKAYEKQEVPVGAVVVYKEMIIARAHNLTETLRDPTAHAEMQAITAATSYLGGKYLTDCTIYVTLEPCAMCAGAIGWSQASGLVYGATDEKKGYTRIKEDLLHSKTKAESGIMEPECKEILLRFFRSKRNQ